MLRVLVSVFWWVQDLCLPLTECYALFHRNLFRYYRPKFELKKSTRVISQFLRNHMILYLCKGIQATLQAESDHVPA